MKNQIRTIPKHIFLICIGAFILLPFAWMFTTSLTEPHRVFGMTLRIFPDQWLWENYTKAYQQVPFAKFMVNSFIIAGSAALGQVLTCSLAGYAFARLRFPGKNALLMMVLGTMMIPSQVVLIPQYMIMRSLGLINSHWALIIPGLVSPFGTFLLRQYFVCMPREIEDAAKVDGCSIPRFFLHIAFPMAKPIVATLAVLAFIGSWGNFIGPLTFLNDLDKATVPLGLYRFSSAYSTSWPSLMAAATTSLLPSLILYLLAQRSIIQAYSMGGVQK